MKQIVDLTRENFDRIDFTEAKIIDLYCQYMLPDSLEFKIWGATILLNSYWKHERDFLSGVIYKEYLCVIQWPFGFCNLRLLSKGNVKFEFDSKDMIPATEYVINPAQYTFREETN